MPPGRRRPHAHARGALRPVVANGRVEEAGVPGSAGESWRVRSEGGVEVRFVRFGDVAQDSGRGADRDDVGGERPGDDAAGADDRVVADGYRLVDGYVAAYPDVVADGHRLGVAPA